MLDWLHDEQAKLSLQPCSVLVTRLFYAMRVFVLLFGLLESCAASLPPPPASFSLPETTRYLHAIDEPGSGREAAQILSQYLAIETVNPPGNETLGARFLAKILSAEGIESEIIEFAPN